MAIKTKYTVISGSESYLILDIQYGPYSIAGSEITFVGSSGVESIFLVPSVSVDFTNSGGNVDRLFLAGNYQDYTISVASSSSILTISRTLANGSSEYATVSASVIAADLLIFADGAVSTSVLRNHLVNNTPFALNSTLVSSSYQVPQSSTSVMKAVCLEPSVLATVPAGGELIVSGSSGVDVIYVRPGSTVDASNLGGEKDLIYFTGRWVDYHKEIIGSKLRFSRLDVNGNAYEMVIVAAGTASQNDDLIFADGKISTLNAKTAFQSAINAGQTADSVSISSISGYNPVVTTQNLNTIVSIFSNQASLKQSESATVTFTFMADPSPNFSGADLTVTGGVLSHLAVTADPKIWTATLTPANGVNAGTLQVSIHNTSFISSQGTRPSISIPYDTLAPAIAIAMIATDNIINSSEVTSVILGTVEANSTVRLNIAGIIVSAAVVGTNWSYQLTQSNITGLGQGIVTITALATDAAGNTASAIRVLTVDTVAPVVVINTIAGNDILNASEINSAITGTTEVGSSVSLILGGVSASVVVSGTTWSYPLTQANIAGLGQGSVTMTALATDAAGNVGSVTRVIDVDTVAPTVSINPIATDDVINANEITSQITGINESGASVGLSIGGQTFAATVSGTTWSYQLTQANVTSLGQGSVTITALATDAAGNIGSVTRVIAVDTVAPTVTINAIATDDVINANEITSQITGANESGSNVSLRIGGQTFAATVSGTTWSYQLTQANVTSLGQGSVTITALATDAAGNIGSVTRVITVDTVAPTVTINAIATDDVINASEVSSQITGTNESGASVGLSIGGQTFAATVSGTTWSYQLTQANVTSLGQGSVTITALATDAAGNIGSVMRAIMVDTVAPTVAIGQIASDDIISANEVNALVTGTMEAGASISLNIAGTVVAAVTSGTTWSYQLTQAIVTSLGQGSVTITALATDAAGNVGSVTRVINVDTVATVSIHSPIAGDDIINASEVTSVISGLTEVGSSVVLGFGGGLHNATVIGTTWVYTLSSADVTSMGQGNETIQVIALDRANNLAIIAKNIFVDTVIPSVTVNTVAADDIVSANEAGNLVLSGTVESGALVHVVIAGATRSATVTGTAWSYVVSGADLTAMGIGPETLTVLATDASGNIATVTKSIEIEAAVTLSSSLDDVTNFDVTSNIVLTASENITVRSGFVRIINDGGAGYSGEATVNSQIINVTDASKITISGNKIIINPADLDFANSYHIEIDQGAFIGVSGLLSSAITNSTRLNFSTVTPLGGNGSTPSSAAASVKMSGAVDTTVSSFSWWDIQGVGSGQDASPQGPFSLGSGPIAMVFKDYDPAAIDPNTGVGIGVGSASFQLSVTDFGSNDMIYIDQQGGAINNVNLVTMFNGGSAPTTIEFDGYAGIPIGQRTGSGIINITLAGTNAAFGSVTEWINLLGGNATPIVSA